MDVISNIAKVTPTIWIAIGAVVAAIMTVCGAIVTSMIMKAIKISEFRQAWIIDLREDIAEYISKADEWMDVYIEYSNNADDLDKRDYYIKKIDKLKYGSLLIHRRIRMRFKLDDEKANVLLKNLLDLLNPNKIPPSSAKYKWGEMADDAVTQARQILKEEWEVAKHPIRRKTIKILKLCIQALNPRMYIQNWDKKKFEKKLRQMKFWK